MRCGRGANPLALLRDCYGDHRMTSPFFPRGVPASKNGRLAADPQVDQGQCMYILCLGIAPVKGDALIAYNRVWMDGRTGRLVRVRVRSQDEPR